MDHYNLKDKVALITGASGGLGEHFAKTLAEQGVKVIVAARREDRLAKLVSTIRDNGGEALAVALDVTDADSVEQALDQGEAAYGPVGILVNNAGVADSRRFLNVDENSWDFVMDTNLKGAWRVANAIAHRLVVAKQPGSIVNIASILGMRQAIGESTYGIAKAGIVQLTKYMALELVGKGIRVNALCPGYFKTELNADFFNSEKGLAYIRQTPARRLGELHELNAPLLLLCSDAGSFINGVALPVDGGHLVSSL